MKKSLLLFSVVILLSSCVNLPDLSPNGSGENSDMLIVNLNTELVSLSSYVPDTIIINDSITILLSKTNENTECSDVELSIEDGQILKEIGNYTYYDGLSSGSLLGNATFGSWESNYRITDRFPVPTILCQNDHLIVKNKDVYLGFRVKFDNNNNWHYGWLVLYATDSFPSNQTLTLKKVGVNKSSGTNVRIGG